MSKLVGVTRGRPGLALLGRVSGNWSPVCAVCLSGFFARLTFTMEHGAYLGEVWTWGCSLRVVEL